MEIEEKIAELLEIYLNTAQGKRHLEKIKDAQKAFNYSINEFKKFIEDEGTGAKPKIAIEKLQLVAFHQMENSAKTTAFLTGMVNHFLGINGLVVYNDISMSIFLNDQPQDRDKFWEIFFKKFSDVVHTFVEKIGQQVVSYVHKDLKGQEQEGESDDNIILH